MSDKPNFELLTQAPTPPRDGLGVNVDAAEILAETVKKPSYREQYEGTKKSIIDARRNQENDVLELDRQWQSVIDEWNAGEKAWHDAMKNRRNEEMQKRRNGGETDVDRLRNGELNGKPREYSPEDLSDATQVRWTAEDIRIERASSEEKKPAQRPELANLDNQADT
jgi:hypothetical protein